MIYRKCRFFRREETSLLLFFSFGFFWLGWSQGFVGFWGSWGVGWFFVHGRQSKWKLYTHLILFIEIFSMLLWTFFSVQGFVSSTKQMGFSSYMGTTYTE